VILVVAEHRDGTLNRATLENDRRGADAGGPVKDRGARIRRRRVAQSWPRPTSPK
jgi:hypothetical protein